MIKLNVEPRKVYTWDDFVSQKPTHSIALDGFVADSVKRCPKGPYANFDHHCGCDRLSTRATSDIVHMEINLGLFKTFQKEGIPEANVWVNDADADVCLSVWELMNHERITGHAEPLINKLVYCVERLDCAAGLYPIGNTVISRQMAWIFQPYYQAREEGNLSKMTASDLESIIEAVGSRITAYTLNQGKEIAFKGSYEVIGGNDTWKMVKEQGIASRVLMLSAGIHAFVSYNSDKGNGFYNYSLGRSSVWIPFDLNHLMAELNKAEGDIITKDNFWGGSNTIGGSPRLTGSKFSPKELEKIINDILKVKIDA